MEKIATAQSDKARFLNTTVLTMCFTAWNIVLVTLLARNEALNWGAAEIGWLISIPILTWTVVSIVLHKDTADVES
ncbi:MAG: hypothetical protein QGG67_03650 [Gammaproteobacteria bacterium]|jgi:hypothetical protein|nr:hypothetical protein [Gammaproteobacteria bacterium]MDP6095081.1 hypothetical protein [Gammaproteobacteria bacterium]